MWQIFSNCSLWPTIAFLQILRFSFPIFLQDREHCTTALFANCFQKVLITNSRLIHLPSAKHTLIQNYACFLPITTSLPVTILISAICIWFRQHKIQTTRRRTNHCSFSIRNYKTCFLSILCHTEFVSILLSETPNVSTARSITQKLNNSFSIETPNESALHCFSQPNFRQWTSKIKLL